MIQMMNLVLTVFLFKYCFLKGALDRIEVTVSAAAHLLVNDDGTSNVFNVMDYITMCDDDQDV